MISFHELFRWWAYTVLIITGLKPVSSHSFSNRPYATFRNDGSVGNCNTSLLFPYTQGVQLVEPYPVSTDDRSQSCSVPLFFSATEPVKNFIPNLIGRVGGKKAACEKVVQAMTLLKTEHHFYQQIHQLVFACKEFRFVIDDWQKMRNFYIHNANQILLSPTRFLHGTYDSELFIADFRHEILHALYHLFARIFKIQYNSLHDIFNKTEVMKIEEEMKSGVAKIEALLREEKNNKENGQLVDSLRSAFKGSSKQNAYRKNFDLYFSGKDIKYIKRIRENQRRNGKINSCSMKELGLEPPLNIDNNDLLQVTILEEHDLPGNRYLVVFTCEDPLVNAILAIRNWFNTVENSSVYPQEDWLEEKLMGIVENIPFDMMEMYFPTFSGKLKEMVHQLKNSPEIKENALTQPINYPDDSFTADAVAEFAAIDIVINAMTTPSNAGEKISTDKLVEIKLKDLLMLVNSNDQIFEDETFCSKVKIFLNEINTNKRWRLHKAALNDDPHFEKLKILSGDAQPCRNKISLK